MKKQKEIKQQQKPQNAPVTHTNAFYANQNSWWKQRDQALSNIASYVDYASPFK